MKKYLFFTIKKITIYLVLLFSLCITYVFRLSWLGKGCFNISGFSLAWLYPHSPWLYLTLCGSTSSSVALPHPIWLYSPLCSLTSPSVALLHPLWLFSTPCGFRYLYYNTEPYLPLHYCIPFKKKCVRLVILKGLFYSLNFIS